MFGFFGGSSAPTVPTYPECPTPTNAAEYAAAAEKAKTTILELLSSSGWTTLNSPVAGIELTSKSLEGSPADISRATAVMDIPIDKLLAEVSSTDGARFMSQEDDLLDWKVTSTIDEHNVVVYSGHKVQFPVTNRELCYLRTIHKMEGGKVLVCGTSINDANVPNVDGRVRAVVLACWYFEPEESGKTRITRCIQLDPKGSVPTFLINAHKEKAAKSLDALAHNCK